MIYTEEDIIRKIQMLLATAESLKETSPEAAASYAAKAQVLIQQYNIEQNKLRKERGEEPVSNVEIFAYNIPGLRRWMRDLLISICECNFCRLLYVSGTKKVEIFGEKANIDACIILYEWLISQIQTMADHDHVAYISKYDTTVKAGVWKYNYSIGASSVVMKRLFEQFDAAKATKNEIRALVVANTDAIQKAIDNRYRKIKQAKARKYDFISNEGLAEGIEAGKRVVINKQLEA